MQARDGGAEEGGAPRGARPRPEPHDELHGVVAEHAHARVAHDLPAGHVREVCGQEVEDGLGDPDAVHVHAVQHYVKATEALVALEHGLWLVSARRPARRWFFFFLVGWTRGGESSWSTSRRDMLRGRDRTYRRRHGSQGHLIPTYAPDPVVLPSRALVLGQVGGQPGVDVVDGRGAEQVGGVEELAVLCEVAVLVRSQYLERWGDETETL